MHNDLFSDLQDLGFDDIEEIDLFNKEKLEELKKEKEMPNNNEKEKTLLYDREILCPVCNLKFKVKSVKKEGYNSIRRDSDSFIHYQSINPYFYDVWICDNCGYSAMESDFFKIKSYQIPLIIEKITPKWLKKTYPETYDVTIAIERYKFSLLNYFYMDVPASRKAMNCLKIAWMYRMINDSEKEIAFLKQAIAGFEVAYFNEAFPIYKIDKFSMLYLLGELNRRIGDYEKALSWFSQVIISIHAPQKIKEKTRDQRDLIDAAQAAQKKVQLMEKLSKEAEQHPKKEKFFDRFFKK
jgi:uncharacterized protein (DUF2225 family)